MYEVRDDEPQYAKLYDPISKDTNRYGNPIELIPSTEIHESLNINHDPGIGTNPNRNKQHGFHFTADNCIGCHACEAACSEKNNLPPHLAFRSVGYVEGGTFPDYTRMNISMACNHCDDPVCLKGCPTRAYTKHPEYGAVIQDPDICFGCGYCTWVCPYNAPQLDPVAGQVEKCNMCVDRLEVGLKPACVSACIGNALDFGVMENIPDRRDQIDTQIPGFPDPNITQPNIRFQQTKSMPREVTRTDSMPVKYKKDDTLGHYTPQIDRKNGITKHWNFSRLSSSENPLVLFTLAVQTALGLFSSITIGNYFNVPAIVSAKNSVLYLPSMILVLLLTAFGLLMSVTHVGKPLRFYRGFNNWRHSPVSREGLGVFFFMIFLSLHILCLLPTHEWVQLYVPSSLLSILPLPLTNFMSAIADSFAPLALTSGGIGLYYMYRCYRIPARPFWNHWSTATHFIGNSLSIGGMLFGMIYIFLDVFNHGMISNSLSPVAHSTLSSASFIICLGVLLESTGLWRQATELKDAAHEGAVSHYIQSSTFGFTYLLRNIFLGLNISLSLALFTGVLPTVSSLPVFFLLSLSILSTALIGRSLFYVLVIPTTMPGAFFWKNKGFIEHAQDLGMHHNVNTGVPPLAH
jgi:DMSO reductase iron-sulfur subunit